MKLPVNVVRLRFGQLQLTNASQDLLTDLIRRVRDDPARLLAGGRDSLLLEGGKG